MVAGHYRKKYRKKNFGWIGPMRFTARLNSKGCSCFVLEEVKTEDQEKEEKEKKEEGAEKKEEKVCCVHFTLLPC
jgi:hypothetical protein